MNSSIANAEAKAKGNGERKRCPGCGEKARAFYIPTHLPYRESKEYKGVKVCANCRFDELPTMSFQDVL